MALWVNILLKHSECNTWKGLINGNFMWQLFWYGKCLTGIQESVMSPKFGYRFTVDVINSEKWSASYFKEFRRKILGTRAGELLALCKLPSVYLQLNRSRVKERRTPVRGWTKVTFNLLMATCSGQSCLLVGGSWIVDIYMYIYIILRKSVMSSAFWSTRSLRPFRRFFCCCLWSVLCLANRQSECQTLYLIKWVQHFTISSSWDLHPYFFLSWTVIPYKYNILLRKWIVPTEEHKTRRGFEVLTKRLT